MTSTIDAGGRVVIPKPIRDALGLHPGSRVEVELRDGRIEVLPAQLDVRLVVRDGVLVAEPTVPVTEALTVELVRETLEATRR